MTHTERMTKNRYAAQTTVPVEKTKMEIELLLRRYGADQFVSGWDGGRAMIGFKAKNRFIRFVVPLPVATDYRWKWNATPAQKEQKIDQDTRQRFRALLLVMKAKLEAVESGIATFENEFLAHIVLPNGQTVSEALVPQLRAAYETGRMPKLLELGPGPSVVEDVIEGTGTV